MKIRGVDKSDIVHLFEWRNDSLTRHMSKHSNKVTYEEHKKWFEYSLTNPLRKMYIGITEEERVGICRFDLDKIMTSSEVTINLNPIMRGKNLSYDLLFNSIKIYKKENQVSFTATIKKENRISLKIFEKYGFLTFSEDDEFYYLRAL